MNKSKLYIILISGLLLSNILMVYYILANKPHKRPKPREIIIERLNFDSGQITKYDLLIKNHRQEITEKEKTMMNLKNELYFQLNKAEDKLVTDSLALEIGKTQTEIEHIHYAHFKDIKNLCHEDQMDAYNKLISELAGLFNKPPMNKNPQ